MSRTSASPHPRAVGNQQDRRLAPAQPRRAPRVRPFHQLTGRCQRTGGQLGRGEAAYGARFAAEASRAGGTRSGGRTAPGHPSGAVRQKSPQSEPSRWLASRWLARCTTSTGSSMERRTCRPGSRGSDGRLTLDGVRLNERDRRERVSPRRLHTQSLYTQGPHPRSRSAPHPRSLSAGSRLQRGRPPLRRCVTLRQGGDGWGWLEHLRWRATPERWTPDSERTTLERQNVEH